MGKYLITLDLDGTLLNSSSVISPTTKETLENLKNDGHIIVIATGRPYRATKQFYDELNLSTPLIVDNGAAIYQEKESLFEPFRETIPKSVLDELFLFSKENIVTAFYNLDNNIYIYNYIDDVEFYYFIKHDTNVYSGDLNNPDFPEPTNFVLAIKPQFVEAFENYISNNLPEIDFRRWFKDEDVASYEVFSKGVSKGSALNKLREFYNIPLSKTISFGDSDNDIELLKESGHGVKMKNGSVRLKTYHAKTSHTNDDDGVIKYLLKFFK